MGGWMDGWMDGWVDGKAGLRIAYSNQKLLKRLFFCNFVKFDQNLTIKNLIIHFYSTFPN